MQWPYQKGNQDRERPQTVEWSVEWIAPTSFSHNQFQRCWSLLGHNISIWCRPTLRKLTKVSSAGSISNLSWNSWTDLSSWIAIFFFNSNDSRWGRMLLFFRLFLVRFWFISCTSHHFHVRICFSVFSYCTPFAILWIWYQLAYGEESGLCYEDTQGWRLHQRALIWNLDTLIKKAGLVPLQGRPSFSQSWCFGLNFGFHV